MRVIRRVRVKGLVAFIATWVVLALATSQPAAAAEPERVTGAGVLEFDGTSEFSHVRVRRRGDVRSLIFVRDNGEEVFESRLDLKHPAELQFPYLKFLFTSYLLRPQQQDVLIIGLGGGGMIHFLRRTDPGVSIDAVEIDPLVVEVADKFFGVKTADKVRVITADGLKFIAEPRETKAYDVIYLDAFLKPSADTDATGVPLALRTLEFYKQIQTRLKPGGLAAFNINPHPQMQDDLQAIAAAFPQTYEFPLPRATGSIVLASTDATRATRAEIVARATPLDERFETTINFRQMALRVRE